MNITAVVVTREGLINGEIMDSLSAFDEVIVWDNRRAAKDVKVFGRFAGAMLARNDMVYVQDDDCVADAAAIVAASKRHVVTCNMPADRRPEYAGSGVSLIGWGTVFARSLVEPSFRAYLERWPQDELFERECDRLFSYVNRRRIALVDFGVRHLPHAYGADRMGREARHRADFAEMRRRAMDLDEKFTYARERTALGVEVI